MENWGKAPVSMSWIVSEDLHLTQPLIEKSGAKTYISNRAYTVCKGSREEVPCGELGQSPKVLVFL